MCAELTTNTIGVDGNKTVTVSAKNGVVKVVTQRGTGRKDTFTLTAVQARALAGVLSNVAAAA